MWRMIISLDDSRRISSLTIELMSNIMISGRAAQSNSSIIRRGALSMSLNSTISQFSSSCNDCGFSNMPDKLCCVSSCTFLPCCMQRSHSFTKGRTYASLPSSLGEGAKYTWFLLLLLSCEWGNGLEILKYHAQTAVFLFNGIPLFRNSYLSYYTYICLYHIYLR